MPPVGGVDYDIFYTWAKHFVDKTEYLRRDENKLILVMDGYSCHIAFKRLFLFKENNIIVLGLPAHTSHVLKPLQIAVFWPLKGEFWRLLAYRTVATKKITAMIYLRYVSCLPKHITRQWTPRMQWEAFANLVFGLAKKIAAIRSRLAPTISRHR